MWVPLQGAADRLDTRTTGVPSISQKAEGSCGFRVLFGPWRQQLSTFLEASSFEDDSRQCPADSTADLTFDESSALFRPVRSGEPRNVFASRASARPPPDRNQRREASIPRDAWSPGWRPSAGRSPATGCRCLHFSIRMPTRRIERRRMGRPESASIRCWFGWIRRRRSLRRFATKKEVEARRVGSL
jgi:hypothetical protein